MLTKNRRATSLPTSQSGLYSGLISHSERHPIWTGRFMLGLSVPYRRPHGVLVADTVR